MGCRFGSGALDTQQRTALAPKPRVCCIAGARSCMLMIQLRLGVTGRFIHGFVDSQELCKGGELVHRIKSKHYSERTVRWRGRGWMGGWAGG